MQLKIFGDTQQIGWADLNIHMPFAPIYELATKYQLTTPAKQYSSFIDTPNPTVAELQRTFEFHQPIDPTEYVPLINRIKFNTANTIAALDTCTSDCISIHIGGGYHHAGKYPNTGYAYSLVNDIIWAVDYQLAESKTVGIIDLDFHFGGGTWEYYVRNPSVYMKDWHHQKGVLHKHQPNALHVFTRKAHEDQVEQYTYRKNIKSVDKILLNIGTDWLKNDALFGQYGQMEADDLLDIWKETVQQIVNRNIPLTITCGGGYGSAGLPLYEQLISFLQNL